MSTLKGTTMHPRCRHIGETYLNVDFSSSAQVKIQDKFNFERFWKKKSNFLVPMLQYSRRTFRWCINYLGRTGIDKARAISFLGVRKTRGTDRVQFRRFRTFWKKFKFLGFHGVGSTREDHSIDVSITNVGLILTKLRWFQLFIKIKIRISNFFLEINEFWGFMV